MFKLIYDMTYLFWAVFIDAFETEAARYGEAWEIDVKEWLREWND